MPFVIDVDPVAVRLADLEVRWDQPGQATPRNVTQNLVAASADNSPGLPVALGVLYPFIGLLLSPILAALAMSFSSVTVITNANRLQRFKLQEVAA